MIVDDEPLAVKMLEDFVSRTPYLRLAASFNDPVLALSTLRESSVDVLFVGYPDAGSGRAEPLPHGAPRYEGDLHDRL